MSKKAILFGGSPINANNPANLQLWLKADVGVFNDAGVTPATNGQTVQQWNDQSISGFNATQATAGRRPTYMTNVNGFKAIQFGGAHQLLAGGNSDLTSSAFTVFAVFDTTAIAATFQSIVDKGDATATGSTWQLLATNQVSGQSVQQGVFSTFHGSTNNEDCAIGTGISNSRSTVVWASIRVDNNTKRFYQNGILCVSGGDSGNSMNAGNAPLGIGNGGVFNSALSFSGNIYEVMYYNRALSDRERENVERYLLNKYAITGITRANTPFFNIATFDQTGITPFSNTVLYIEGTPDGSNFAAPAGVTNPVFTFPGTGGVGTTSGTGASSLLFNNNTYFLAYEFNNGGGNPKFGIAKSSALGGPYAWIADVTVLASSVNAFVWNPRWLVDDNGTIYIICGAQNAPINTALQPFIVTALNPGTFTSWSSARQIVGSGLPANIYDFWMVTPNNSPNSMYNIWFVDGTSRFAGYMTSSARETGYTVTQGGNDWMVFGIQNGSLLVEGPVLHKYGNVWRAYWAADGLPADTYYFADSYDNWAHWTYLTQTNSPIRMGTGTILFP